MALAEHLKIDGEHERIAIRGDGARENIAREATIANDVKLKPERLFGCLRHLLDRIDRHGRQGERDIGLFRRLRGQDLAVAMLHAAQPDRRQRKWRADFLADDGGGEASLRDVDHHALAQLDPLEIGAVRAQRLFVIGAAVDIIEESFGNLAPGKAHAGLRCR